MASGDFWQLDPPDGGFLGDIPAEFIRRARMHCPAPTVSHGQSLVWGGAEHGIQGVTELEDRALSFSHTLMLLRSRVIMLSFPHAMFSQALMRFLFSCAGSSARTRQSIWLPLQITSARTCAKPIVWDPYRPPALSARPDARPRPPPLDRGLAPCPGSRVGS